MCILLLFLPIIFITYGSIQKNKFLKNLEKKNGYTIRVIGSNIKLDRFYNNIQTEKVIKELISISSPEKKKNILFVWPEGIIPNTYRDELNLYSDLFKKYFDKNHLIGLGITSRKTIDNQYEYYNSLSIFDNNLDLIKNYNKVKLVPFGEFLPFEKLVNKIGLKTITNNFGSFSKGENRKIIKLKNGSSELRFLPLICYEIIYSGNLTKNSNFDFILNISEDGWFGKSIGPKQHLSLIHI